jgi:hypothetical protein
VVICLCFGFVFFLINILDLYLDLLILYQKGKCPKILHKTSPKPAKTGPKPKLKNNFKITGY